MAEVLGTTTVNGGKATLTRKRCDDCGLAFVVGPNEERERCIDCDPPDDDTNLLSVGRDSSLRPTSEKNYHGGGYRD